MFQCDFIQNILAIIPTEMKVHSGLLLSVIVS